jgi:hypothetical protein
MLSSDIYVACCLDIRPEGLAQNEKPLSRNRCADFTFKQNKPINAWVIIRGNTVLAFIGFRSGVAKVSVILGYGPALMGMGSRWGKKVTSKPGDLVS